MTDPVVATLETGPIQGLTVDQRWNGVLLKLPAIAKNSKNEQQGFKYRSIDDVLDRLNPLFGRWGVHVVPVRQTAEREHRTTARGNLMNVCYLTVDWEIRSVDGETMHAQTVGEGTDSGDKATSKAQTMALKYLLWPSLVIATNEDPDGQTVEDSVGRTTASKPRETQTVAGEEFPSGETDEPITRTGPSNADPTKDVCSPKQAGFLRGLLKDAGYLNAADVAALVNKEAPPWPDSLNNLSKAQASTLIELLKA